MDAATFQRKAKGKYNLGFHSDSNTLLTSIQNSKVDLINIIQHYTNSKLQKGIGALILSYSSMHSYRGTFVWVVRVLKISFSLFFLCFFFLCSKVVWTTLQEMSDLLVLPINLFKLYINIQEYKHGGSEPQVWSNIYCRSCFSDLHDLQLYTEAKKLINQVCFDLLWILPYVWPTIIPTMPAVSMPRMPYRTFEV